MNHDEYMDDIPKHRKKSKKKSGKKSDHKHEYILVSMEEMVIKGWFTHKESCKVCGKVRTKFVID